MIRIDGAPNDLQEEIEFKFNIYGFDPPKNGETYTTVMEKVLKLIEKLESGLDEYW